MNQWVRLWEDMPTDAKWRVVAKRAGCRVGEVIAVFVHMMTNAGNAEQRGTLENWSDEDVAAALDYEMGMVAAIREAMQGKTLDGDYLTGWEKRQPQREDPSTSRVKAFRERKKANKTQYNAGIETHGNAPEWLKKPDETQCNASVTLCNAPDTDTDTEKKGSSLREDGKAAEGEFEVRCPSKAPSPARAALTPEGVASKKPNPKRDPRSILESVLSPEVAAGVVEHRLKLRKPLTAMAADGLAKAFAATGTPDAAARTMVERGWQGFRPDWLAGDLGARGPPRANSRVKTFSELAAERIYPANGKTNHDGPEIDATADAAESGELGNLWHGQRH